MTKKIRSHLFTLVAAMILVCGSATARAVAVTSSANGYLIYDSFDTYTAPSLLGSNAGQPWTLQQPSRLFVQSGPLSAHYPTAAYAGANYLWMAGIASPSISQSFATPKTSGVLTATLAFWIPNDGFDSNVFVDFLKSPTGPTNWETAIAFVSPKWVQQDLLTTPDGTGLGVVYNYAGANGYNVVTTAGGAPFHFTLDAWHLATVSYNIGLGGAANALSVVVDGTTLDPMPTTSSLPSGSVTGFSIYQNNGDGAYAFIDNVPEPSSLCLLIIAGGPFAWRVRWRAQKTRGRRIPNQNG